MAQQNNFGRGEQALFLSEVLGRKVAWRGKKIGRLDDLAIRETERLPEVTSVVVSRPFGHKPLVVPWARVRGFAEREVELEIEALEPFERDNLDGLLLLQDHVLDKKIVDLEDREVEMVYDVRLVLRNERLYASDVDCSRYSLLKRVGLGWLARLIENLATHLKDEVISWRYVQPLPAMIGSFKGNIKLTVLKEKMQELHPVDLADILEELDHEHRLTIFKELDVEKASDTLEEIEPRVQREIISSIGDEKAAELIEEMTPAQAADVLSVLPAADADDILALMEEREHVEKIESLMDEHEETVLNFATPDYIGLPPQTRVDDIFQHLRQVARDKEVIMYTYVVDEAGRLLGVVDMKELLRAEPGQTLEEIMTANVIALAPRDTIAEAAEMFSRYSFRAIPIVDERNVIRGVIPYRDIMNLKHRLL
jgi:CBS domain-containing protein/sporulation protein YlmC with PRC-barrel domain